jgi:hypothetical protein
MAWESISVFILIPLIGILLFANGWFLKRLFDGLERKISTSADPYSAGVCGVAGRAEGRGREAEKVRTEEGREEEVGQ